MTENGRLNQVSKEGWTGRLIYTVIAAAFGSAFQHGFNTGVMNAPGSILIEWIKEIQINRTVAAGNEPPTDSISQESAVNVYSLAVSIFCLGGMVGGCIVGPVADRMGRKTGLLYNNLLVFLAAISQGLSKTCGSYELFIFGRFVIGVCSGLNAGLVPVYLSEVSPISLRGSIGTVYQLVITMSILISQFIGLETMLGTVENWPILFTMTAVPAIVQCLMLPACPETPKHVFRKTGNEIQTKQVLIWLREDLNVESELEAIKAEYDLAKTEATVTLRELFANPNLRGPLIISCVLMLAQQFSGINAAMFFSTSIFKQAKLSESTAQYATLAMGAMNVAVTLISLVLVERAGRKTLLFYGFIGMFLSTICLFVCLINVDIVFLTYMSVVSVLVFIIFFSIGPGSIPWFLVTELFAQGARPAATSVAVTVNWSANFLVGLGFLPLTNIMGSYVFLIFAVAQILTVAFIYKKVPETKGRTTEEIVAMFRQSSYE